MHPCKIIGVNFPKHNIHTRVITTSSLLCIIIKTKRKAWRYKPHKRIYVLQCAARPRRHGVYYYYTLILIHKEAWYRIYFVAATARGMTRKCTF